MIALMDGILGLVVLEAIGLAIVYRVTSRGIPPLRLLPNLLAGFFLLSTARLGLSGAPAAVLALCLAASLCAHLVDLGLRWNRPG